MRPVSERGRELAGVRQTNWLIWAPSLCSLGLRLGAEVTCLGLLTRGRKPPPSGRVCEPFSHPKEVGSRPQGQSRAGRCGIPGLSTFVLLRVP